MRRNYRSRGAGGGARPGDFLLLGVMMLMTASSVEAQPLSWVENFGDDPVAAGRWVIPPGHDASRFAYDSLGHILTVHYDTYEPTAWYARSLDPVNHRVLGRCDRFSYWVTFRIRSEEFYADPGESAQIGWGLINSQTTGVDRAGAEGPYAFDSVLFDFFPNVSPLFGGPTVGPTVIHSNTGQGYFSAIDFAFGRETRLDAQYGDQKPQLDVLYTARIDYDGQSEIATLRIDGPGGPLLINVDGNGGAGGPDGNPATIQTYLTRPGPFSVDRFALAAWQDTFNPDYSSVIADVDVFQVGFSAEAAQMGDLNKDGLVDARDVRAFIQVLLSAQPDPCLLRRADFTGDGQATPLDIPGFESALLMLQSQ